MKSLFLLFLAQCAIAAPVDYTPPGTSSAAITPASVSAATVTATGNGSQCISAGSDGLTINADCGNKRVGLGTITPATLLDVNGNAQFGNTAVKSTFTAAGALVMGSSLTVGVGTTYQMIANYSACLMNGTAVVASTKAVNDNASLFSALSSTYTHTLKFNLRQNTSSGLFRAFINGDTSANYSRFGVYVGETAGITAVRGTSDGGIFGMTANQSVSPATSFSGYMNLVPASVGITTTTLSGWTVYSNTNNGEVGTTMWGGHYSPLASPISQLNTLKVTTTGGSYSGWIELWADCKGPTP